MGVYVFGKEDEKLWEIVLDLDFLTKALVYIKTVVFNYLHSVSLMREEFMRIPNNVKS